MNLDYEYGIEGRGNGYDYDAGMSVNALDAYARGIKPLSKISKDDLKRAGWPATKTLAMALANAGFWSSHEWHHSGGEWYNKVDFYDPAELVEKWSGISTIEQTEWRDKVTVKQKPEQKRLVRGSFTIWGGSRRRPRRIGEQKFTGVLRGDWIMIDGGGRKKASGRCITWRDI